MYQQKSYIRNFHFCNAKAVIVSKFEQKYLYSWFPFMINVRLTFGFSLEMYSVNHFGRYQSGWKNLK